MNIQIEGLYKNFGKVEVIRDLNLTLAAHEFISILGPSGCGKTTLLRILAGFETPTAGRVLFDGVEVSNASRSLSPEKRNISMVFQSFALWPHLTVRQHLEFPLKHHRFVPDEWRKNKTLHINETLEVTGLSKLSERYPSELSGGQRQRVALARAMVVRPNFLLMDEPLSALDAGLRIAMREEIQRIHRFCGCTVLYVTHDQNEALAMSDRIIIMNGGNVEQNASPKDIYYRPESEFVAKFASNSNILKGQWEGNQFRFGEGKYCWTMPPAAKGLTEQGLCAVRPDQLEFVHEGGIVATVTNVQFQGKSSYYTVETTEGKLQVHAVGTRSYEVQDRVQLWLKEEGKITKK